MKIDREKLRGNWKEIREIEQWIRDDVKSFGISAFVDFYTANGLEYHIIFESANDKNLYKMVGLFKEDGEVLKFRVSPGIVSVLTNQGLIS